MSPVIARLLAAAAGACLSLAAQATEPAVTAAPTLQMPKAVTQADAPYALFGARHRPFVRSSSQVVGVYVPNWERPDLIQRVPSGNLSHVLYAFLRLCGPGQLDKDAAACKGKRDFELTTSATEQRFDRAFAAKKRQAPQLQVLASVGGWGGSDPFFHMAPDAAKRAVFVASVLDFLRAHPAFDGIDIDWEHPGGNGAANGVALGSPQDGAAYVALLQDLRHALDQLGADRGRRYALTTAINTTHTVVQRVDWRAAAPLLDLVFLMSYDFYGGWSPQAGHHSTLAPSAPDADDSLLRAVRNLEVAGVPRAKLVAGAAMYGRGFKGVALAADQPATGAAHRGAYPGPEGALTYREIAKQMLGRHGQGRAGYQARWDATTQTWALYHAQGQRLMGYDDPRAVAAKAQFARLNGLAGVFAWELSQDNGDVLNAMNWGAGQQLARPAR
ncbi:glycoside hydrolase family 18 protein [Roseateles sp. BYS180W]|uniref:chitinase n=1 Tax=Roseateles rivi TaxID=3299028 RepID=A0ABW7FX28_9BURK